MCAAQYLEIHTGGVLLVDFFTLATCVSLLLVENYQNKRLTDKPWIDDFTS